MASGKLPPFLEELAENLPLTMTKCDAARIAQVSESTLARAVRAHELHVVKTSPARCARVIIMRSELLRWMAERAR